MNLVHDFNFDTTGFFLRLIPPSNQFLLGRVRLGLGFLEIQVRLVAGMRGATVMSNC